MERLGKEAEDKIRQWTASWVSNQLSWSEWRDHILGLGLNLEDPAVHLAVERAIRRSLPGKSLGQRIKERGAALLTGAFALLVLGLLAFSLFRITQLAGQLQETTVSLNRLDVSTLNQLVEWAKRPAKVELSTDKGTLDADGRSTATITITVTNPLGQAVSEGTEVALTVQPELGTVPSPVTTGRDGTATATFTAGNSVGTVTITATAGTASARTSLTLEEPPKAQLAIGMSIEPTEVQAGGEITLTFTITNTGEAAAEGVTLWCNIPQGTAVKSTTPPGTSAGSQVQWSNLSLAPGKTSTATLCLTVGVATQAISITQDGFGIYAGQQKIEVSKPEQLPTVKVWSPLKVTVSPTILLATGTPFTVTAQITDAQGNAVANTSVTFAVVTPTECTMCTITGTATVTTTNEGKADFMLQTGQQAGSVTISASTASSRGTAPIEITTTAVTSETLSLWHTDSFTKVITFNLEVPMQLLGKASGHYQKVSVQVWVPTKCVTGHVTGQGDNYSLTNVQGQEIKVKIGATPEKEAGTLQDGAENYPLTRVIQEYNNGQSQWTLVEIEGWVPLYHGGSLQLRPASSAGP